MGREFIFFVLILSLITLGGCYCGWNGKNADCQTYCAQFDDYSIRIGEISRSSREWETVKVDTIQDTIHFAYLLTLDEYNVVLELIVLEDTFILDSINSYVQERTNFSKCYFDGQSFKVNEFLMSPNDCCTNNPNGCIYEKTPGELIANIEADVLCSENTLDFLLQVNFQTLESESCEC